ncbi:uncharacterized protein MAM_06197 [Metarhizium album ARSEF 1941]|uniref:Uncharacterized protein n=1 Tax=Metarhizium album (strain ARSEF 1941) TaxID=1081103 RepID=A0A0B2WSA8_METAS|nr:uncharacterized protein MAM_06197 [Metarhizium album ARSEF 1941]KHN95835.1 hypothetical protein MAM_06197 [Metarhizium album ARSEF 1941]
MNFFAFAVFALSMALGAQAGCLKPDDNTCNLKDRTCCDPANYYCLMQPGWEAGVCTKK